MERRIVNPWTWQDQLGYVQGNEISGMERVLVCAGQTSVDADGQPLHDGDMGAQVGQALDNLEAVLGKAGFALADVVRLNYFVTDVDAFLQTGDIWGGRLGQAGCRPATTLLGVARLASPTMLVEIEATAAR
jgi:enamine deaminase RidA (YjgF/YER057c/UK114 family)